MLLTFVQLFHTKHGKVITAALLGTYGLWLLIGKAVIPMHLLAVVASCFSFCHLMF